MEFLFTFFYRPDQAFTAPSFIQGAMPTLDVGEIPGGSVKPCRAFYECFPFLIACFFPSDNFVSGCLSSRRRNDMARGGAGRGGGNGAQEEETPSTIEVSHFR